MRFIKPYKGFTPAIYENEDAGYSSLSAYRTVALGVSRAFNLLSYFYSIAKVDADPREWESSMRSIINEKSVGKKWDKIISTAEQMQSQIEKYAAKRRLEGVNVGAFFDVGVTSDPIPTALEKFQIASEILMKDLNDSKVRKRLQLIDTSLPLEPYKLNEEVINEGSKDKRPPTETEVLSITDNLSGTATSALSTARDMKALFPEAKKYIEDVVAKYITPATEKVKEVLNTKTPDTSLKVSKSVIKSYDRDGWKIKTVRDKYLIDQYNDLIDLKEMTMEGLVKINKAKDNVTKELLPESKAGEFIEAGNRILQSVENKITKKEEVEELRRRAGLMIPVAQDQPIPKGGKSTINKGALVSPDELRELIRRRVSK